MSLQFLSPGKKKKNKTWIKRLEYVSQLSYTEVKCKMKLIGWLCYLQLCLASDIYFITLIKRMEDLHSAHIYMDSISWGTKRREEAIGPK